jgi:hypothetical protein
MSTSAQDFNAQIIEAFITAHLAATVARLPVHVHRRVLALAAPMWLTHAEGAPKVPRPN